MCVCLCKMCENEVKVAMCWLNVWFTAALCVQFVLARRVLMSSGCSQCGEEGGSVHGRRAGGQSRQSTGEPAGQWRYSDGYNTDDNFRLINILDLDLFLSYLTKYAVC